MLPLAIIQSKTVVIPLLSHNWVDKIIPIWKMTFQLVNKIDSPVEVRTESLDINNILENYKVKYNNVFNNTDKSHILGFVAKLITKDNVSKFFTKHIVHHTL